MVMIMMMMMNPPDDANRPPLYQPPQKKDGEEEAKQAATTKKRKSVTEGQKPARTPSGSGKVKVISCYFRLLSCCYCCQFSILRFTITISRVPDQNGVSQA